MAEQQFINFLNSKWEPDFATHVKNEKAILECYIHEPAVNDNLLKVIDNVSHMLPYSALKIHCSELNHEIIKEHVKKTQNNVIIDPTIPTARTLFEYNYHMTNPDFYRSFTSDKVLIFQTDSAVLQNNILRFLHYDYVGAPWPYNPVGVDNIHIGNGGFSLRNPRICADICRKFSIHEGIPEDAYFAKYFYYTENALLPTVEEAKLFSTELYPVTGTFGMHKTYNYNSEYFINKLLNINTKKINPPIIMEAFVGCEKGPMYTSEKLLNWLKTGIGPEGLYIPKDTVVPYDLKDYSEFVGHKKFLYVKYLSQKDSTIKQALIMLILNKQVQFDNLLN